MGLIVLFFLINISLLDRLREAESQLNLIIRTSDELRHSSDDLTRFARTYVTTGNKKFKQNFYTVLAIRKGEIKRPENYELIYWDYVNPENSPFHQPGRKISLFQTLQNLPVSSTERVYLEQALSNSNDLVTIEEEAFYAMEGIFKDSKGKYTLRGPPNRRYATQLLYCRNYHFQKERIMKPIDIFMYKTTTRMNFRITALEKKFNTNGNIFKGIITLFILFNLFAFLLLHQRIIRVISCMAGEIKSFHKNKGQINCKAVQRNDELGSLINLINTMQKKLSKQNDTIQESYDKVLQQQEVINENIIMSETDIEGNIIYATDAFCNNSGYSRNELLGKNHRIVRDEEMPDTIFHDLWETILKGKKWRGEFRNRAKDGSKYWVDAMIEPVYNKFNQMCGFRSIRVDISDKKRIERLSITDPLTGLNNRLELDNTFNYELQQANRYNTDFSIIIIDIDKFKSVNDTFGHQTGDMVLQHISAILKNNIRKTDTLGRWGGEEFLIICPKLDIDMSIATAEKLRNLIATHEFPEIHRKTASFGVTAHKQGDTRASMVTRADTALYRAKEEGRNRVRCQED